MKSLSPPYHGSGTSWSYMSSGTNDRSSFTLARASGVARPVEQASFVHPIDDEDEVEAIEVVALEAPDAVALDVEAAAPRLLDGATVRWLAEVLAARAGAVDGDAVAESGVVDQPAHDGLGRGRAADVAPADEAEPHRATFGDDRGLLVEQRQHLVGGSRREREHALGDADRLEVVELARVGDRAERHDLELVGIAAV